jgi:hypothetical protein
MLLSLSNGSLAADYSTNLTSTSGLGNIFADSAKYDKN